MTPCCRLLRSLQGAWRPSSSAGVGVGGVGGPALPGTWKEHGRLAHYDGCRALAGAMQDSCWQPAWHLLASSFLPDQVLAGT